MRGYNGVKRKESVKIKKYNKAYRKIKRFKN